MSYSKGLFSAPPCTAARLLPNNTKLTKTKKQKTKKPTFCKTGSETHLQRDKKVLKDTSPFLLVIALRVSVEVGCVWGMARKGGQPTARCTGGVIGEARTRPK